MTTNTRRAGKHVLLGGVALTALLIAAPAGAQQAPASATTTIDLGQLLASGSSTGAADASLAATPGTAEHAAPSRTPLNVGQPTSVISQQYIEKATSPTEPYDELISISPSVQDIQPNGPIAQQNYGESIRGFQYNQFNTLLDGIVIPGTPQTAVYFTNHDIGSVGVDRGPGTAATIGYATFGGTVSVVSKDPDAVATVNPYATMGSYRANLYGLDLETGAQPKLDGGRGFIDVSGTATGAALSGTTTERKNVFLKWVQPLGPNTVVTAAAIINHSYGHTPYGTTAAEIKQYGYGYALNNNPGSQSFYGDNTDVYNTDFEYINLKSKLTENLSIDDTAYTNAYYHNGFQGADPNGTTCNINTSDANGCNPAVVAYIDGKKAPVNDVPGLKGHSDFRDYGNILKSTYTTSFGAVEAGFWFDYYTQSAYKYTADLTQDGVPYTTKKTNQPFTYLYTDTLTTEQPYIQADVNLASNLQLIVGTKYTAIDRGINATINKSTLLPAKYKTFYTDYEPSAELKYRFQPNWSFYGQIAKGFLVPTISVLNTKIPTDVTPETTVNYQAGTSYQTAGLSASADGYYIPFQNFINSEKVPAGTLYYDDGGATFRGVEAEATKTLVFNTSLYINGSLNDATFDDGAQVAQSPRRTGAVGLIYDATGLLQEHDALFATLTTKYVGPQYGQYKANSTGGGVDSYPIKSYDDTSLTVAYTFNIAPKKAITFTTYLDNLLNREGLVGLAGVAGDGKTPLYWTQAGRSVFFSLSGKFS
jgi:iron complex outermembrane receptor protein